MMNTALNQKKFTHAVRDQLSGKGWISGRKLRRLIDKNEGIRTQLQRFFKRMQKLEAFGLVQSKRAGGFQYGYRISEKQFKWTLSGQAGNTGRNDG